MDTTTIDYAISKLTALAPQVADVSEGYINYLTTVSSIGFYISLTLFLLFGITTGGVAIYATIKDEWIEIYSGILTFCFGCVSFNGIIYTICYGYELFILNKCPEMYIINKLIG